MNTEINSDLIIFNVYITREREYERVLVYKNKASKLRFQKKMTTTWRYGALKLKNPNLI